MLSLCTLWLPGCSGHSSYAGKIYMAPVVFLKSGSSVPVGCKGWRGCWNPRSCVPLLFTFLRHLLCLWHARGTDGPTGLPPCFPTQNDSFPNHSDPLCSECNPFVRRDWSRGENFIFVLRSNLILNFSFLHQASTYANYPGVCEQTTCWATLGQISLFVSRNANKTTTNCTIWWDHRASAGKTLHKGEGTYCAANPRLRSKLLWKARVESSFASVVVFPSLKIRIRNLFTDYSIFL